MLGTRLTMKVDPPLPQTGLWSWGSNQEGMLGSGNTTARSSPVQVGSLTTWNSVRAGALAGLGFRGFTVASKTDGTLWSWGYNGFGQLGLGDTTSRSSPVQIGALTTWTTNFSVGGIHTAAIKTDGTLWTWGYKANGVLGQNDATSRSSPTQVGALTNWSKVACGTMHVLAIKTDGTLWAWGAGYPGKLGNGATGDVLSPVQIGALTNWSSIAGGAWHSAAIKTDGTLWVWGRNNYGQLGRGNTTNYSSPVQVGALTTWSKVSCGNNHTLAIKTDGTLWTWGSNNMGSLGQNLSPLTHRSSPVQVGALTTWDKLSGSTAYHSAAIKTDGTLWVWGNNSGGALGLGTTTNYSSPVQVGVRTTWASVSTSPYDTFGIQT